LFVPARQPLPAAAGFLAPIVGDRRAPAGARG